MQQKTSVCMWSVKNENLDGACSIHCSDALKNGNRKKLGIRNGASVRILLETFLEKKDLYDEDEIVLCLENWKWIGRKVS